MHTIIGAFGAAFAIVSLAAGHIADEPTGGRIIITEIMYNPNSAETVGECEWIEIANVGAETVEIKNWRIDDEDKKDWSKFSCTLPPGAVAVLINGDKVTEREFREAWDASPSDEDTDHEEEPEQTSDDSGGSKSKAKSGPKADRDDDRGDSTPAREYKVIGVKWGGIANSPGDDNEVLQLLDDSGDVVCEVKLDMGGDWPRVNKPDGPSIYLTDLSTSDLSDGKAWRKSVVGKDGARKNVKTDVFEGKDVGSPGYVEGLSPSDAAPITIEKQRKKPEAAKPAQPQGGEIEY